MTTTDRTTVLALEQALEAHKQRIIAHEANGDHRKADREFRDALTTARMLSDARRDQQ